MRSPRRNARYLPEIALPPALQVGADFAAAVRHARGGARRHRDADGRARAGAAPPAADVDAAVLWLCKGFQDGTGWLGHEIARRCAPHAARRRALRAELRDRGRARPADRARRGEPRRRPARRRGRRVPCTAALRIYTSADPVGVEVGGAVKNVLAIATGIADGMEPRPQRARRAGHARPGRDDAPRRRARRRGADLHGPVGARRPGPDRDRRPVAQPHGRPARSPTASRWRASSPSSAMSPRACAARRWCCARRTRAASRCRSSPRWSHVLAGAHRARARRSSS